MTRVQLGTTIDSDAKELLEKLAEREDRSIAKYLEQLIRREAVLANIILPVGNGDDPAKEPVKKDKHII